ncbi:MAG TPA: hypothetical protein VJ909_06585, partial [Prolixibacteraceae bacterium]|nr:hypothetical protein [Prolixibacteraceae bacterium]
MQNNEVHIDKLFRERLLGYDVPPPPEVWDNVSRSLAKKRKKRKAIMIWGLSSAASIAVAFILGWLLSGNPSVHENYYAEIEKLKQEFYHLTPIETVIEQHIELKIEKSKLLAFNRNTSNIKPTTITNQPKNESKASHLPLMTTVQANTLKTTRPNDKIELTNINKRNTSENDRAI